MPRHAETQTSWASNDEQPVQTVLSDSPSLPPSSGFLRSELSIANAASSRLRWTEEMNESSQIQFKLSCNEAKRPEERLQIVQ